MRILFTGLAALSVQSAFAGVTFFNSDSFSGNAAKRDAWLAAAGVSAGANFIDFEAVSVGTNLNSVDLGGGASIVHPSGSALVQSSPTFFGSSNPIGTRALAMTEVSGSISLSFDAPVEYVGGYDIDMPGGTLKVTLADNTTESFSWDATGSSGNTAEFWGFWRNDTAGIKKVEFLSTSGGDGEWGLDNIEYGVVPEPGSVIGFGLGVAMLGYLRRRR